ncbi:MAG: hypothetical protein GXO18_00960 [Aquificae bacterium]|nr:hypothetical protein [Aquificota bacterium]
MARGEGDTKRATLEHLKTPPREANRHRKGEAKNPKRAGGHLQEGKPPREHPRKQPDKQTPKCQNRTTSQRRKRGKERADRERKGRQQEHHQHGQGSGRKQQNGDGERSGNGSEHGRHGRAGRNGDRGRKRGNPHPKRPQQKQNQKRRKEEKKGHQPTSERPPTSENLRHRARNPHPWHDTSKNKNRLRPLHGWEIGGAERRQGSPRRGDERKRACPCRSGATTTFSFEGAQAEIKEGWVVGGNMVVGIEAVPYARRAWRSGA